VALVVSEVVTNAVVHAGTAIGLSVQVFGGRVRVEVQDGSPHLPDRREQSPMAGFGRGLMLIESVVDAWGVARGSHGKTVWFEVGRPADARVEPSRQLSGAGAEPPADLPLAVQLLHTPLVLYAAWQPHVETLLREYLLVRVAQDPARAVAEHAAAHDAIALLQEAVPPMPIGSGLLLDDPERRAERRADVLLQVPPGSVDSFAVLARLLDEAARPSIDGSDLLTAPVPEVLKQLRGWLCREVFAQAAGAVPTPWQMPEPGRVPAGPDTPEGDEVSGSSRSLVLVAESMHIVAASASFATLLGYAAADLAGLHVHAIIPPRLREAHAAGFALHQLTGRDRLLTREVTLPGWRADATEVPLAGRIRRQVARDGTAVVLAELG
jgi:PAS domain S-box-containing protein